MSVILKNKVEAIACRGCLSTVGKLYSILDVRLLEPYEDLIGYPIGISDACPKYLCMYCRSQLLRFMSFRVKCRKALEVLTEAQDAGYHLTTGYVRSIDRNYYKLNFNYAETETVIIQCGFVENNTESILFETNSKESDGNITDFEEDKETDVKHSDAKNTIEFESLHKILQNGEEKSVDSNTNEEWSNEYLDISSESNMDEYDSNIRKNSTNNETESTIEIRDKNPSVIFNNNTATEKRMRDIDKKDSSDFRNDSDMDKNYSDDEDDMKESDSDIEDLINLFLKSPTNYVKTITEIGNKNDENVNTHTDIIEANNTISETETNIPKTNISILETILQRKTRFPKMNHVVLERLLKRKAKAANIYEEIPKKKVSISNAELDKRNNKIKNWAEKAGFNVKFFTKYDQFMEYDKRRRDIIRPPYTTKCEFCGEDFETNERKDFETHLEKCHNPNAQHICQICRYRFESKRDLVLHLRTHKYEFTCKHCELTIRNKSKLFKHYNKMHKREEVQMHICAYCAKVTTKSNWYFHMKSKHPTELLSCDLCSVSLFFNTADLKKHYDSAHKDIEEVKCDCNSIFLNQKALSKHKASTRCDLYPCKCCGVNLATEKKLQYHLFKHRMQCNMSEDYYNECGGCNVLFQSADALETHVEVCLAGGFPCVHCGESYKTNELFNKHITEKHASEEAFDVKNIKMADNMCEVCGKCFKSQRSLKQHQLTHSDQPRVRRYPHSYPCFICSKHFPTHTRFLLHLRVHTGERPHQCQYCSKSFKWQTGLAKHMKWHHIRNPHICPICGMKYRKELSLEKHIQRHNNARHRPITKGKIEKKKKLKEKVQQVSVQYDTIENDEGCEYLVLAEDSSTECEDNVTV